MKSNESGHSLVELLAVMAMLGTILTVSFNVLDRIHRATSLVAATSELRSVFHSVRMLAVARSRNIAVKFEPSGSRWTWALYEDGDGDGVRNDDIQKGRDRQIQRPRQFEHHPSVIGVPLQSVPDPLAPGKQLQDRSPVRFGTSTLCSFSQNGEATNGSVVITDGARAVILQVGGGGGRIGVLRWNGTAWKKGV